jgi:hypothetical protein
MVCLAYSQTLMMEAIYASERPAYFQRTTRRYSPKDRILQVHRCQNLKSSNSNIHVCPGFVYSLITQF